MADNPSLPGGQLSEERDGHAGAQGPAAEDPPGHIPWAAAGTRAWAALSLGPHELVRAGQGRRGQRLRLTGSLIRL